MVVIQEVGTSPEKPRTELVTAARAAAPVGGAKEWLAIVGGFAALVIAYSFAFAGSGWHPTDYEYVPSQAWRLFNGEVPYRDFIYHKPPGTLMLHWVWSLLPDTIEVRASRVFVYLQFAAATAIPVLWAVRRRVVDFGWRLVILSVATTILALHSFPIMPWQTTDGIFFAIAGWVCLLESTFATPRAGLWRALASASLAFALLCKQSFILSCGGFAVYVLGELAVRVAQRPDEKWRALRMVVASVAPAFAVLGGTFLWLWLAGAWPHFVAQFQSQSTGQVFVDNVSRLYRDLAFLWILVPWTLVPFLRLLDGPGLNRWVVRALALVPLAFLARAASQVEGAEPWTIGRQLGPHLAVAMAGLIVGETLLWLLLRTVASNHPARASSGGHLLALGAGALLIALGCQLSLGYNSPILGLGIFGLLLHGVLPRERSWLEVLAIGVIALLMAQPMWRSNVRRPYRDAPRPLLTRDLGTVFPKLQGIKTWPENYERYAGLKRLVTEKILPTGRPFVSLQDYPGLNWLFDTRNPIGIDWCYPPEPDGFEPRLIDELVRSEAIVVMPKDRDAGWGFAPRTGSIPCQKIDFRNYNPVSGYVVKNWRVVGENDYFCLFSRTRL